MLKLNEILARSSLNEAVRNMQGTIGSENVGMRHVKNYVLPTLDKTGAQRTISGLAKISKGLPSAGTTGSSFDPKASHTHLLGTKHGEHPIGTPIKITHVIHDKASNTLHAATEKHGTIPLSRIAKPTALAKPPITKGGFDVEGKISHNLGTKAAGSTKTAYDFSYKGDQVRGNVKEVEHEKSVKGVGEAPILRGESKLDKGKFGQSVIKHNSETKKWSFSNEKLGKHFAKATHPTSKLPILQHLDKFHPKGVIKTGFAINAPHGSTAHYLKTSNVNALHIHDKKTDTGTTFTFGKNNDLAGRTKLGHLSDKHVHALDGKLNVASTSSGATTLVHRPKQPLMKQYAKKSVTDPHNNRSLHREDHAQEFMHHVKQTMPVKRFKDAFSSATSADDAG